ncbi:MAG: 50S ribosomal protein L29 [Flavobacteriaceae bacterium]|jgi:large subunit ribosomal protein L29|nr:50S ribosomal protein L29 [Flavobacteriaceae bacterium]|tara:strand:- start:265 stop:456 length:192 start_codon:yes stop_codon:yes gene_type:complete
MKQKEITILTDDELNDKLGAFQKNLHDMKLTHAVSPLENPLQIRNIRRTIARLKTELLKRTNK